MDAVTLLSFGLCLWANSRPNAYQTVWSLSVYSFSSFVQNVQPNKRLAPHFLFIGMPASESGGTNTDSYEKQNRILLFDC